MHNGKPTQSEIAEILKVVEGLHDAAALVAVARELVERLYNDADAYQGARSDAWKESPRGEAYEEWVDTLQEIVDELDVDLSALAEKLDDAKAGPEAVD